MNKILFGLILIASSSAFSTTRINYTEKIVDGKSTLYKLPKANFQGKEYLLSGDYPEQQFFDKTQSIQRLDAYDLCNAYGHEYSSLKLAIITAKLSYNYMMSNHGWNMELQSFPESAKGNTVSWSFRDYGKKSYSFELLANGEVIEKQERKSKLLHNPIFYEHLRAKRYIEALECVQE